MILGIDTSNYTTSVAVCGDDGDILCDLRQVLPVEKGGRGLRQSEALFHHVKNLPELVKQAMTAIDPQRIQAVGVSTAPRPQKGSYMPVFRAGIGAATMLSTALTVPCYRYSHQEGHIRAAFIGHEDALEQMGDTPILAVHFSGGTSEIVLARRHHETAGFTCQVCAESPDLHAGQLIDRIGVRLGFDFPAGKAMEKLACEATARTLKLPSRVSGSHFHFSGLENAAVAALKKGTPPAEVSHALFETIGRTLGRVMVDLLDEYRDVKTVVFSGGVMANRIICETAEKRVRKNKRFNKVALIFADAHNATDNAQGIALMARDAYFAGLSSGKA